MSNFLPVESTLSLLQRAGTSDRGTTVEGVILSLFFVLLGLFILSFVLRFWQRVNLYRTGRIAQGLITDKGIYKGNKAGGRYSTIDESYVRYNYDIEGKTRWHEQRVDEKDADAFQVGDAVTVRYHARRPSMVQLDGPSSEKERNSCKTYLVLDAILALFALGIGVLSLMGTFIHP